MKLVTKIITNTSIQEINTYRITSTYETSNISVVISLYENQELRLDHSEPIKIHFITGWNLVGFPYRGYNVSVETMFQENLTKVEAVFSYNRYTKEWNYWINGLPEELQTLKELIDGNGYWIKTIQDFNHKIIP